MKNNLDTHGCVRWFIPFAACMAFLSVSGPANSRTSEALDTGCFGKHLDRFSPDPALRKKVAASLVFLVALRENGSFVTSGTGFVVKDSAPAGGTDRTVTASHIAAMSLKPGVASLTAFSSAGTHLGTAKIVALGDKAMKPGLDTYGGFKDMAVLSIIPDDAEDDAAYRAIEGLDVHLSSVGGPIFAYMGSETSMGVGEGDSGAPLVDAQGVVLGILSKVAAMPGRLVSFPAPSMASWINGGSGMMQVKTSPVNFGAFVRLGGTEVVESLGMTSIPAPSIDLSSKTPVMVAGFQSGGCTVSFGSLVKTPPL